MSAACTELELQPGATLDDAWDALARMHPGLEPHRRYVLAARNAALARWETPLTDGDQVAFLPPVSGGSDALLTDRPIDVAALEAQVGGGRHGAVVTFVGRAREIADDGRLVVELEYEAYPEMAERVLAEIVAGVGERWPETDVAVVHRIGTVPIGDAAVAIVTAARHRAEAYEANRFVIEAIKERLPVWKRERFADGSEWKRPGA
ncbi:MAG: molybdenum cofactor biosynthesis protein MoaE [Chloroflexota bacterium]|nr:molybdenum cofactor biosynthesis protein MoaE [Chloroflexota bacterium]